MTTNLLTTKLHRNLTLTEIPDTKEDIQLIWLDENINDSVDYRRMQLRLLEAEPSVQFFSNIDRCFDLIKATKDEKIFLIVSPTFAPPVLSEVQNYPSLVAVFIFCINDDTYISLTSEQSKFAENFTDQDSLLRSIREKMYLIEKQIISFGLYNPEQKSLKDLTREAALFFLHQMLILVLKQLPNEDQPKQKLFDVCKIYYKKNPLKLTKIEEFQETYTDDQAIESYINESFLFKLLNKAFRTEDIELIIGFRFFIIDLCTAIEQQTKELKHEGIITLYRGTQIPIEDLENLKDGVNKIISINGFFYASRNSDTFIRILASNFIMNNFKRVFFEIKADPSLKTIKFANMIQRNGLQDHEKILFNLNSNFKIQSVQYDSSLDVWKVQLITTDECSEKVQDYLTMSKSEMEESTPIINYGYLLLYELGDIDQADKYFNLLLKLLPAHHSDIASVFNNIGNIHNQRDEWDLALSNFEISYEIRKKRLDPTHPHIGASLNNIGMIHKAKENPDLALEYFKQSLPITEKVSAGFNPQTAMVNENMGKVYSDKGEYDPALIHLLRALAIFKNIQPEQHREIARCLGAIGYVYEKKNNNPAALDYYQQQLKLEERCLPYDHPNLINHLDWIVDTYRKMDANDKALKVCKEKLHMTKTRLGDNHPFVAQILMIMADLLRRKQPTEAFKYYEEAVSVLEVASPPDNRTLSVCLSDMSRLYNEHEMYKEALQTEHKALELYRRTLPCDHVDIAKSLKNLGRYYEKLNSISEAFRHYTRSLSMYRANYGSQHAEVKSLEADLTRLMSKRTSLDLVEAELSSFMEESSFMLDSSYTTQGRLSLNDLAPDGKPAAPAKKNTGFFAALKSKTCILL